MRARGLSSSAGTVRPWRRGSAVAVRHAESIAFSGVRRAGQQGAARAGSAPPARDTRAPPPARRARSQVAPGPQAAPALRPVFLWARQRHGKVTEVRCEDYDARNRIRIVRTPGGWRVIPRTEIYNAILVSPRPRRRRKRKRARRSRVSKSTEPTALDSLLAVAELEFNQQRGEDLGPDREAMSFDPTSGLFFDGKTQSTHAPLENAYQNNIGVHKDLFDTISEAHYLPDLNAEHDEALLESLVEKGCEDNQILGHELSKLADLVHAADADYAEEEDDLSASASGTEGIHGLDHTMESSNSSNSLSAAQGLLNLQNIGEHLQRSQEESTHCGDTYLPDDMFVTAETNGPIDTDVENIDAIVQNIDSDVLNINSDVNNLDVNVSNNHITEHGNVHNIDISLNSNHITDHIRIDNINNNNIEEHVGVHSIDNSIQNVEKNLNDIENSLHIDANSTINNDNYVEDDNGSYGDNIESGTNEHNGNSNVNNDDYVEDDNGSYGDNIESGSEENITLPSSDTNISNILNNVTDMSYTINSSVPINDHLPDQSDTPITNKKKSQINNESSVAKTLIADNSQYITDSISLNRKIAVYSEDPKPTDLSMKKNPELSIFRYSPKKTHELPLFIPRAPSRESDSMQSPQPSGIPAVPLSPELFTMPQNKINKSVFLESLLTSTSTSPKMYTSEVTITKQQCEPLNLGKHRKSASPTVTSCTDELRKDSRECREYGEPHEKRSRKDSMEIHKVFNHLEVDIKAKEPELPSSSIEEISPLEQFQRLKNCPELLLPDPLLVPKDKLNDIISAPSREIPALLLQKPELRFPEALARPAIMQNPDILVISLSQLESILNTKQKNLMDMPKPLSTVGNKVEPLSPTTDSPENHSTRPKPVQTTENLAGDIDAATAAALSHMLWYQPYMNQMECMGQNNATMELLKSYKHSRSKFQDMSQMYSHSNRIAGAGGYPMTQQMEFESNRLQIALWQEAINQASRQKSAAQIDAQIKELATKSADVQNPYVHSTKSHHNRSQSAARTSPVTHNYGGGCQRGPAGMNPYAHGSYSGVSVPGLQIPYYNPNTSMDRRPRSHHSTSRSPTSPYFPNNNYLQSVKKSDHPPRSASSGSVEGQRPKISVKPITNLMDPEKRAPRRELEVGSTTHYAEQAPLHDPSGSHHLWHPLFGNQQGYSSPWSWTTVTATGD